MAAYQPATSKATRKTVQKHIVGIKADIRIEESVNQDMQTFMRIVGMSQDEYVCDAVSHYTDLLRDNPHLLRRKARK